MKDSVIADREEDVAGLKKRTHAALIISGRSPDTKWWMKRLLEAVFFGKAAFR